IVMTIAVATAITPSLAYMGEAASSASAGSYGVAYGLYNFAWAVGLLAGPAVGGFLFERLGFPTLALVWSPWVLATTLVVSRTGRVTSSAQTPPSSRSAPTRHPTPASPTAARSGPTGNP